MTRAEEFYEGKLGLSAVRTGADGSKVYASAGDEALEVYPSPDVTVQGAAVAGSQGWASNSWRSTTSGFMPCLRAVET
jgi:hypothetical protein